MVKITLKAARVNANLTQKESANRLNVSNKTICNWESGVSFPPANMIPAICELYGIPFDSLNFLPNDSLKAKQ